MTNEERANAALDALEVMSELCGPPLVHSDDEQDCIADLIGNLMHHAERKGYDPKHLVQRGVGMWSAERRAPLVPGVGHEPGINDEVAIHIIENPVPTQAEVDAGGTV